MFCPKCGKEIAEDAVICIGCGRELKSSAKSERKTEKPWSTDKMVLFGIFSFLLPVIGIAGGIYGLVRDEKRKQGATLLTLALLGIAMYISFAK